MSKTIYILGRLDCPRVTHCKALTGDLVAKIPQCPKFEFVLKFETEFEEEKKKLLKENISFLNYSQSPIIYGVDESTKKKEIIGSLEEFQKYIVEHYMYHDSRKTEDFVEETKENLRNFLESNGNKYVYMKFKIEGEQEESKVVFELLKTICPKTAENFFETCKGFDNDKGKTVSYKGSTINRVSPTSFIQGGDINTEGAHSIYGGEFTDENYDVPHNVAGILGMVKKGGRKHSNECQFYITLCPLKSFDKKLVAFGRVIQGYDTIIKIGDLKTDLQRPVQRVEITECGEFVVE